MGKVVVALDLVTSKILSVRSGFAISGRWGVVAVVGDVSSALSLGECLHLKFVESTPHLVM